MISPDLWDTPAEAGGMAIILLIAIAILGAEFQYSISKYFHEKYSASNKWDIYLLITLFLTFVCIPLLILLRYHMWADYQVGESWDYLNPQERFDDFFRESEALGAVIPFFLGITWASLKNKSYVISAIFSLIGYSVLLRGYWDVLSVFGVLFVIFLGTLYEYSLFRILYEKFHISKYWVAATIFSILLIFLVPVFEWNGALPTKYYFPPQCYLLVTLLPLLIALGAFLLNLHLRGEKQTV